MSDIVPLKLKKYREEKRQQRSGTNRIAGETLVDGDGIDPLPYDTKKIMLRIAKNDAKPNQQFLSIADCQKIYIEQCLSSLFLLSFTYRQVIDFTKILLTTALASRKIVEADLTGV